MKDQYDYGHRIGYDDIITREFEIRDSKDFFVSGFQTNDVHQIAGYINGVRFAYENSSLCISHELDIEFEQSEDFDDFIRIHLEFHKL
jgi:hypothetical protein